MKLTLIIITIIFGVGCLSSTKKAYKISGIWIPENVDWKEGGFSTFIFSSDSTAIVITSSQKKIKDSIYFQAEPGINIQKGAMISVSNSTYILRSKALYRFIKLPNVRGDELYIDTITFLMANNPVNKIKINNRTYVPGVDYTKESKDAIYSIVTKMIPAIEQNPQLIN